MDTIQDILRPERDDDGSLSYCKNQIITTDQIAVLIIKPSNSVSNANNTAENIASIIGRFEAHGWELQAIKKLAGGASNIARVIAHYPQPFYDSEAKDVRSQLSDPERQSLLRIWGEDAEHYPIYHPLQLVESGRLDYATIATIWHAGRGENNQLLDSGDPAGINTVTPDKDARYGKRRLLLVKDHPTLPDLEPFFIVNGFAAELVLKFSRPGERITIMAFGQVDARHNLDYLREYVIGETKPHKARPGSIRYDALHAAEYSGLFPVVSRDIVGVENNIVHLSDSVAEAHRELALWMPEVMWYPPQGPFAPDIPYKIWEGLRERYLKQHGKTALTAITNPNGNALTKWSSLPDGARPVAISVNIMAGGSGGRFFGYELPEHLRSKFLAPIVPIGVKNYSFLELQLARLAGNESVKRISIFATETTARPIQAKLDEVAVRTPALAASIRKTAVLKRIGVPRIVPMAEDLLAESKFQAYYAEQHSDAAEQAAILGRNAGSILLDKSSISSKPPGHFSVFLHYIHYRLKDELAQGIEVAFFHIGEDPAAAPDTRFLAHAKAGDAVAYISVVKSPVLQPGHLISNSGSLQLLESAENADVSAPFFISPCRIAINLSALASFLAGGTAAFMKLNEIEIRQRVAERITDKLTPRFEVKPISNYTQWAGQFAYAIGQVSEAVPTEYILGDGVLTFIKTQAHLSKMLPIINREYGPYLNYLETGAQSR